MLLDGNSLAYRAFFALPTSLALASGQVTNAVFGFTSMLIKLLKDHAPDQIAVAPDRPEPTFRHELVSDYKAGRAEAPDILRQQLGLVRQVVETLKIPIIELAGYEADDCIGTLATCARDQSWDVIVVTGDRDTYQLVEDPHVKVLYNKRGVSDYVLYDEAGIIARTGVHPTKYPEYAALRGDPSDNLPGVPGVGEKTAAKLINDYGNLDGVFANVEKATPKLRQNLIEHEAQVRSNAKATPLVRDLPIQVDINELRMGELDADAVHSLFAFLEFRTLYDRLVEALVERAGEVEITTTGTLDCATSVVRSGAEAVTLLQGLAGETSELALAAAWVDREGGPLAGIAVAMGETEAAWIDAELLDESEVAAALAALVSEEGRPVDAHRSKELMRGLDHLGIDVQSLDLDVAIAGYLLDPADSQYLLEDLAARYL